MEDYLASLEKYNAQQNEDSLSRLLALATIFTSLLYFLSGV